MSTGHPLTEEQINFIRAHFKDTPNQALADALGISKAAVSSVQRRYGLTKTAGHNHDMAVKAGKASAKARDYKPIIFTEEMLARRSESYKKTFREEWARYIFGLPQKTRIKVSRQPRKKLNQRAYLKHLGYIIDDANNIAFYTPETKRAVKMEAQPRVYYFFKPYEQQREQEGIQVADRSNP